MPEQSAGQQLESSLKKREGIEPYVLDADGQKAWSFYIDRVKKAKEKRDNLLEEFDDQNYEDDYIANRRALISYLRRKKNDDDVRVNTGVAEKGIEKTAIEILSLNLQPEIRAFDTQDREIERLGDDFADIIKRTNEMESYDDKRLDIVLELLGQRIVVVEEVWVDKKTRGKRIKRCEKRLRPGLGVFFGDPAKPAYLLKEQPYIVIVERMDYFQAKLTFGEWDNWKFVKPGMLDISQTANNSLEYRMSNLGKNEVEVIYYYSYPDDEYQVIINGVLMCELGTKLPWRYEGYNLSVVVVKPIPGCIYGKPPISSAKTLQSLSNETIRNVVRYWRQFIEPPIGTRAGKIWTRDVWSPGKMTQGMTDKDFTILNPNNHGLGSGEIAMMDLVDRKTNEFLGSSALMPTGKKQTATEILQRQKEAVKMLGLSVIALKSLERQMSFLRIYNGLENLTKPRGRKSDGDDIGNIYNSFTINNATLEDGKTGTKHIMFTDKSYNEDQMSEVFQEENKKASQGINIRYKFINVKKLDEIVANWYITIIAKEQDSSELDKVIFQEKLNQAANIMQVTQRPLNADKVIEDFERTNKVKGWFGQQSKPEMINPQKMKGTTGLGQGIMAGAMAGEAEKPSLNSLLSE